MIKNKENTAIKKKKNVTLSVRVSEDIKNLFDLYHENEGRDKKWIATRALEDFLRKEKYIK